MFPKKDVGAQAIDVWQKIADRCLDRESFTCFDCGGAHEDTTDNRVDAFVYSAAGIEAGRDGEIAVKFCKSCWKARLANGGHRPDVDAASKDAPPVQDPVPAKPLGRVFDVRCETDAFLLLEIARLEVIEAAAKLLIDPLDQLSDSHMSIYAKDLRTALQCPTGWPAGFEQRIRGAEKLCVVKDAAGHKHAVLRDEVRRADVTLDMVDARQPTGPTVVDTVVIDRGSGHMTACRPGLCAERCPQPRPIIVPGHTLMCRPTRCVPSCNSPTTICSASGESDDRRRYL